MAKTVMFCGIETTAGDIARTAGISLSMVSLMLAGKRNNRLNVDMVRKLSRGFGVSLQAVINELRKRRNGTTKKG